MTVEVEFFVEDVRKDRQGRLAFVGISNQGRGVRVGDRFVVRYEVRRSLEDVLSERPIAEPVNHQSVSLTVTAIDSMRAFVNELPLGVTGALYLEGEGIGLVAKNTFLKTSDSASCE